MSFFCIVAWEWRVPGGIVGSTRLVGRPVCVSVCVCVYVRASHRPYPSTRRAGQTLSPLKPSTPTHTHTQKQTQWKGWHTTSHPPAIRRAPNNLSPSLRDCLCVLWLFTVKWPLVLLMASYVVIIFPPWKSTKSHCVGILREAWVKECLLISCPPF